MRKSIIYVSLTITLILSGCSLIRNSSGTKAYSTGQYSKASSKLKKEFDVEKKKNIKGELAFALAESYRAQNLPSKAAAAYSKAIKNGYEGVEPYVYMGQSLLKSGKTPQAQEAFEMALEIDSRNHLAKVGIKSCDLNTNNSLQTAYKADKIKQINSKYSDYCPTYDGENYDHIYFTSMRYVGKERTKSLITGQAIAHIFESTKDTKGEWSKPEKLPEPINSIYEEGSPFVTSDGKEMYITRCMLDKGKIVEGQIYKILKSAGIWGEPTQLQLGGDSLLFAHPALSADGNTLYFSSNMPGGKGGKDIWKIEKKGTEEWGKPINLGFPLNTPGNEMFPYIKNNGTLYFCSDGHPGFGGLDIFKTSNDKDGEITVENMGTPINSISDDFGITFSGTTENGLFSTSRDNTKAIDNIYSFYLPELEFKLALDVLNERTMQPIKNSYLKIIGSDGTQLKMPIPADGKLKIGLTKDCDYTMLIAAKGFMYKREKFNTRDLSSSKTFEFKTTLLQVDQAFKLDSITFAPGRAEIASLSNGDIKKIKGLLASNNDMNIEVGGHTDLTKEDNIDVELSNKRAQAIVNLIVAQGGDAKRISTKGYSNTEPLKIDDRIADENKFLKKGEFITEKTISKLRSQKEKEAAENLLRRVEIKVVLKSN